MENITPTERRDIILLHDSFNGFVKITQDDEAIFLMAYKYNATEEEICNVLNIAKAYAFDTACKLPLCFISHHKI